MASTTTEHAPEGATAELFDLSMPARVLLASFSAAAGAIHLVMAPIHATSSSTEALLFAAAGWFQIVFAGFVLTRPNKRWLQVAVLANVVFIGAWVISRTAGLPFGAHSGVAETVGTVDLVTVTFEVLLIAVAAVAIVHPRVLADLPPVALAVGAGVPLAVFIVATLVVVSPTTATHSHSDAELAAATPASVAASSRCDASLNPVAYWQEAKLAGTDGVTPVAAAAPAATPADRHNHGAAAAPAATSTPTTPTTLGPLKGRGSEQYDKLIQLAGQPGEAAAGFLIAELANATDDEYHEFIASLNPAHAPSGHTDTTSTGNNSSATAHTMSHLGPQQWRPMTDPADCQAVTNELARTKAVAMKYPTAADAMADGYARVAPYVPGIASHWMKFPLVDGTFDIDHPEMLLYDGNGENAHITGVSYYVVMPGDTPPSQGFTGDNDLYHRHLGLCTSTTKGGVIGDSTTTDEECAAMGGKKANGGAGWMSHAWVVPGCESPWGVFSGTNPLLDKALGDASGTNDGGCSASAVRGRYDLSAGSTETLPTTTTVPSGETQQAAGS